MTKSERITSIVLASILLLTIINSTWFFLGIAKVSVVQWIVFNACAPAGIAFTQHYCQEYVQEVMKYLGL
ncbi:MAG: hypothetical protein LBV74_21220 [Tannerella sp.]|jgi:hypothetical protein|nr:hypothetical protein [Tannerella sp.]